MGSGLAGGRGPGLARAAGAVGSQRARPQHTGPTHRLLNPLWRGSLSPPGRSLCGRDRPAMHTPEPGWCVRVPLGSCPLPGPVLGTARAGTAGHPPGRAQAQTRRGVPPGPAAPRPHACHARARGAGGGSCANCSPHSLPRLPRSGRGHGGPGGGPRPFPGDASGSCPRTQPRSPAGTPTTRPSLAPGPPPRAFARTGAHFPLTPDPDLRQAQVAARSAAAGIPGGPPPQPSRDRARRRAAPLTAAAAAAAAMTRVGAPPTRERAWVTTARRLPPRGLEHKPEPPRSGPKPEDDSP